MDLCLPVRRQLARPGATVSYAVRGQGPAVLLGHSLLLHGDMWERVAPALAQRFTVIDVDARGHRHSRAFRPFDLDELAEDWLAVLDAEGVGRASLVGLSMGGMTAMRAALTAPARVERLVLLDTSAAPQPRGDALRFRLMAELTRRLGFRRALLSVVERLFFSADSLVREPALSSWLEARIRESDPRQIYWAVRAVIDRQNVLPALGAIGCPTTVLVGAKDVTTPPGQARAIASAIPDAALHILDGVGHLPPMEAPAETLSRLLVALEGGRALTG